jgi:phage head maturation protease
MALIWLKAMVTEKGVNSEERTVEGMASTIQPDLIRDVILPSAWRKSLARWKKRGSIPKFLAYHMHRLLTGHSPVLGPMLKLNVVPEGLLLKAEFAETELGNEHLHLYGIGAMDYFSVGFQIRPGGATMVGDDVRRLLAENGIRARVPEDVDRIITEAELLEVSAVVIGANLGALVTASADPTEACCGMCGEEGGKKCKTPAERALRSQYAKRILERLEKCASIIPDGSGKAVHEDEEKLLPEEPTEFNGIWLPAGVDDKAHPLADVLDEADESTPELPPAKTPGRNLAEVPDVEEEGIDELLHPKLLAPPEGDATAGTTTKTEVNVTVKTGEPEGTVIDPLVEVKRVIPFKNLGYVEAEGTAWRAGAEVRAASVEDLMKMSAWVDAANTDVKGSYKLPHHRQSDFKAIWRGVAAAMGALLGARGGVAIPANEKRGVYNHIKKHYAHWDKEAPEFRDYEPEEMKGLEEEGRIVLPETLEEEQRGLDRDLLLDIVKRVEGLESREDEREKESKTFLETLAKAIETNAGEPGGTGSQEHHTVPPKGKPEKTGEVDGLPVLTALLEHLEKLSGPDEGAG